MRVLKLAGQLHLNPQSRCRMIRLGGDIRWIGWDSTSEAHAATHDLIIAFASGENFSEGDRYPRPGFTRSESENGELFAPTIADFSVGQFMSVINS